MIDESQVSECGIIPFFYCPLIVRLNEAIFLIVSSTKILHFGVTSCLESNLSINRDIFFT